jgi:hypothetical protein
MITLVKIAEFTHYLRKMQSGLIKKVMEE